MYSFGKQKTGVFMLHFSLQSLWISYRNINIVLGAAWLEKLHLGHSIYVNVLQTSKQLTGANTQILQGLRLK